MNRKAACGKLNSLQVSHLGLEFLLSKTSEHNRQAVTTTIPYLALLGGFCFLLLFLLFGLDLQLKLVRAGLLLSNALKETLGTTDSNLNITSKT